MLTTSTLELQVSGSVHSPVQEGVAADWGAVEATIEVQPTLAPALQGLMDFSHALVVFSMHQSTFVPDDLVRHPQGRTDLPRVGIFAQRAKHRPNPIGITAVEILSVDGNHLRVRGLDAIHGTPVLDLKPYFPWFDGRPDVRTPAWCEEIMRCYF